MRRMLLVVIIVVTVLGLAACGSSSTTKSASGPGSCTPSGPITQTVDTSSYKMVLDIGSRERMYTQAQAKAQHPNDGEVMLRGQMTDMGGMANMANSASVRHLEVHICSRSSGQVETNLAPAITLVDNSASNMTDHVPSAVMQGTTSGQADLHYGNNVTMPPGRRFTVTVAASGQTATFHVSTPPSA